MVIDGKKTEALFIDSVRAQGGHLDIVFPRPEEDMFGHWDVQINNQRYDVKSVKRWNRNDTKANLDIVWVEFQNVRGNSGWLYGQSDYIAFERDDHFAIVLTSALRSFSEENLLKEYGKKPYHRYTRAGRQDLLTIIPFKDIEHLVVQKIKKV